MKDKQNCLELTYKIIFVIFSKMQFTCIVITRFISIKECVCSQISIVINVHGKEYEAKVVIHSAGKRGDRKVRQKRRARAHMIQ